MEKTNVVKLKADLDRHIRTLTLLGLAVAAVWAIRRASNDIHTLSASLERASEAYGKIPAQLAPAVQQLTDATAKQIKTLDREDQEVLKTSAAVDTLVVRLDQSLTEEPNGILPRVGTDLDALRIVLAGTAHSVDLLGDIAGDARGAVQALTVRIKDPRYDQILANAAQSMESIKDMTASGAHAIAKADEGVTYEVAQLEKPVKKIKVVLYESVGLLGKFFGFH
jgi:hypothetical protein